jgi:hypothetical protein
LGFVGEGGLPEPVVVALLPQPTTLERNRPRTRIVKIFFMETDPFEIRGMGLRGG